MREKNNHGLANNDRLTIVSASAVVTNIPRAILWLRLEGVGLSERHVGVKHGWQYVALGFTASLKTCKAPRASGRRFFARPSRWRSKATAWR